jgi:hypothetical protein
MPHTTNRSGRPPEAPVAAYAPTKRHMSGRDARVFDIVEGKIIYADAPVTAFRGQIVRINPKFGTAEIALIKRPAAIAKRVPYFRAQNLAYRATAGRLFVPLDELQLRSRASRPIAPYLKASMRNAEHS